MDDYICKPFQATALNEILKKYLMPDTAFTDTLSEPNSAKEKDQDQTPPVTV